MPWYDMLDRRTLCSVVLTSENVSRLKWTAAGIPGQQESVLNLAVGFISKSSVNVMIQYLG